MNYTINQLRVFLKVVEKESITKAADALSMTQPAVSIQLKNFQDQFSIPLTQHIGRTIHITDFGHEIATLSRQIMNQLENLRFKTKDYRGLVTGKLRISSASTGKYVVPYFLSAFLHEHSGIDLQLDVTNKSKVIDDLKSNSVDFAIISVLPETIEVHEEILLKNELHLISNAENVNKKMPLIYREPGSATRSAMENYFSGKKYASTKRIELTSNEAVKQAVIAGIGHSILPLIGIRKALRDGSLCIIKRAGLPITTDWRLVWLKGKVLSPAAQAYLDYIRLNKGQILDSYFSEQKK